MPIPLLLHGKHPDPVAYEPFGGWIVPWRFGAVENEYRVLRAGVGLVDYSIQAVLECRGDDRVDFLHRLLTNDIARLAPGTGCQAALLTPTAKLIAEVVVLADPEAHWLLCDLQRADALAQALERYRFAEGVTLINHERRWGVLALQGPGVAALAEAVGLPRLLADSGDHALARWDGVPVRLVRHSLTGDDGLLSLVPAEDMERLWHWLQARGSALGARPAGWEALNIARIEAGLPWTGPDLDEATLLPETGLEAVLASGTKGCYPGQEIVARMQTYGTPSKRLMGLLVDGAQVPEPSARIVHGSAEAGWITSACRSPALGRPIALGYVRRGADAPGTLVDILQGADRMRATVAARPLFRR